MQRGLTLGVVFFMVTLFAAGSAPEADSYLEYTQSEDEFTLIFINKQGLSWRQVYPHFLKRAAKTAKAKGFSYFTLEPEQKVQVIQVKNQYQEVPRNLYQEKILQQGWQKEGDLPVTVYYPGYKVQMKGYVKKPFSSAKRVCDYVPCA